MQLRKNLFTLFLSLLCAVGLLAACGEEKRISGDSWLIMQGDFMPELQAFSDGMDEVYTLYITEAISPSDFEQEWTILWNDYLILQAQYLQAREEHPIKPESYSYVAQKGVEAMEDIRVLLGDMLNNTHDADGRLWSPMQVSYMYLTYKEQLTDAMARYITAYQMVSDMYGLDFSASGETGSKAAPQQEGGTSGT